MVRGQSFCKLVAGTSENTSKVDTCENIEVSEVCLVNTESQYADLTFYLKNGYAPFELDSKIKKHYD